MTRINADLRLPARVDAATLDWVASPSAGVERKRLARLGDEVARVTSLVRYAPNSAFPPHTHSGGEEFLVLEGVFSDEHGDYPAGTWVRNGVGTRHTPRVDPGCTIFVKLWWHHQSETDRKVVHTRTASWELAPFGAFLPLEVGAYGQTALWRLVPGSTATLSTRGGAEVFVLEGAARSAGAALTRWSWQRLPGPMNRTVASQHGALLYVRQGHLASPPPLPPGLPSHA